MLDRLHGPLANALPGWKRSLATAAAGLVIVTSAAALAPVQTEVADTDGSTPAEEVAAQEEPQLAVGSGSPVYVTGDRLYGDITVTPEEAFLDLRAESQVVAQLLSEVLLARGEIVSRGVLPSMWFQVGDSWMRIEPLPYLQGAWSRVRVRVGNFSTELEQARAEDLLSELALSLEGFVASTAGQPAPGGSLGDGGVSPQDAVDGGFRATSSVTDVAAAVEYTQQQGVGQQPIEVYVPVEVNNVIDDSGDDGVYGYGYGVPVYGYSAFYGYGNRSFYSPYAYCSPWAYGWLSYNNWSFGYQNGWHGYSSYSAWCSPFSGWGWHPYGAWWNGFHSSFCGCSSCVVIVNNDTGKGGGKGGQGGGNGGGKNGGGGNSGGGNSGGGGDGGGLLADAESPTTLRGAATPVVASVPQGRLGQGTRVGGLDAGDGALGRTPGSSTSSSTSSNPDVTGGGVASGGAASGGVASGLPTTGGADLPRTPPTGSRGSSSWAPTVRTVSARTVQVSVRDHGQGSLATPSLRSSSSTRSAPRTVSSRSWETSVGGVGTSSTLPSGIPVVRSSSSTTLSRAVASSSSRGTSTSITEPTSYGTRRTSISEPQPTISIGDSGASSSSSVFQTSRGRSPSSSSSSSTSRSVTSRSTPTLSRSTPSLSSRSTPTLSKRSSSASKGKASRSSSKVSSRKSSSARSSKSSRSSSSSRSSGRSSRSSGGKKKRNR